MTIFVSFLSSLSLFFFLFLIFLALMIDPIGLESLPFYFHSCHLLV